MEKGSAVPWWGFGSGNPVVGLYRDVIACPLPGGGRYTKYLKDTLQSYKFFFDKLFFEENFFYSEWFNSQKNHVFEISIFDMTFDT